MSADGLRKTALVILAWNRWDLTRRCLETLRATDLGEAEVLVVDNGSEDETPERLAELCWVRTVRLPRNAGFVRGNNAGIAAAAPGSDVVLINNDIEFTQFDWLVRLRRCAYSAADVGVAGCRMVLPDGRLLHAGTYMMADTLRGQQIGSLETDVGQYTRTREVEGVVFACAYLRREVIDAIGGLALDFESYFEDSDYCLRARQAGFKTLLCGEVTLIHDEHGSTRHEPERLDRLLRASREVFRRKWAETLRRRYHHEALWQSIMNFPTGYATSCRALLRALDVEGVRVAYRYIYGPKTVFPPREPEASGDYRLDVIRLRKLRRQPEVGVVYGQGDVFGRGKGRHRIGYTMLEVDGFPRDWVGQANRMDEVWVPSDFNRDGFLRCGLERPIHVMPLGVDIDHFHPRIVAHPNPMGEFVFLSIFEWGERKDPGMLLQAFSQEFSVDEPVRLLCKVINRDPTVSVKTEIRNLGLRQSGGKISYMFNVEFPHYQLGSLYRSADAYVASSRGEGWNMPLMEAMACGLPAIVTDWGAHRQFAHQGIAYMLRCRGTVPALSKCPYYAGFSWADPDPEHLRQLLREIFENRDEARHRGHAAASEIARRWTWQDAARRINARLAALMA